MLKYKISPEKAALVESKEMLETWDKFLDRKNKIQKEFQKALK